MKVKQKYRHRDREIGISSFDVLPSKTEPLLDMLN